MKLCLPDSVRLQIAAHLALDTLDAPDSFSAWLPEVSPTFTWTWPHLQYIIPKVEQVISGEIKKLMIFLPPRHGKSECVTVRLPAFLLEQDPTQRIIVGAYNQLLANKFSRKTRKIARERIALSSDRTSVEDWETPEGGGYRAVGVGSGVTGQGCNGMLIDDPVKSREEANSIAYRERCWDWYTEDMYTRLEPGAWVILIMTRWHEDDLAGRILKSEDGPNWTVVNLPALAEVDDPLKRKEGQALCPERYNADDLARIKSVLGSAFTSLYQQRPSALEGEIFKREWWKYYNYGAPPVFKRIIQSWDTAFKKGQANDPSGCLTWGETDNGYYLLDRFNKKMEYPLLKQTAKQTAQTWKPAAVLIEDKASGQSLIQELKQDSTIPILPISVDIDKVARAHSVTPIVESGRCYLPDGPNAPSWVLEYIDQMAMFPNAEHDEDVDCTSQALAYLARGSGTTGFLDFMAQVAAGQKVEAPREPGMVETGAYWHGKGK